VDLGITLPTSGPHASPVAIVRMAQEAERLLARLQDLAARVPETA
jgi:hypothetical protein